MTADEIRQLVRSGQYGLWPTPQEVPVIQCVLIAEIAAQIAELRNDFSEKFSDLIQTIVVQS
jgi:hypothetical protein